MGALKRSLVLLALSLYTAFAAGPFVWAAMMSLRTTTEISRGHFDLPIPAHWEKFPQAWFNSNYSVYFANSTMIVLAAVLILTIVGAMAAHALGRYRFRFNRLIYFVLFSTIIFPPQVTIIALFQILVQYGLYDTKIGLTLVYVSIQLPLTVYILESFFARIPSDLFDAARMDGYSEWAIFWRVSLPIALPALATTVILNFILLWNEFLYAVVLITEDMNRTLPLGIQRFMGDQLEDVGMIATGLMIAVVPVIVVYAFFSERLIQGMTAGAVK
jgi:ABC-type glycerol-3-phosphate transport system permease component